MQLNKDNIKSFVKGLVVSITLTLIEILIFAGLVKAFYIDSTAIKVVNQFIKIIAIFVGCLLGIKEKGIVYGIIMGLLYTVIIHLIFMIICKCFFGSSFWLDMLFGLCFGGISGIITTNLKKR